MTEAKDTPPGAMAMSEARLADRLERLECDRHEDADECAMADCDQLANLERELVDNLWNIITALRECATLRAQVQAGREEENRVRSDAARALEPFAKAAAMYDPFDTEDPEVGIVKYADRTTLWGVIDPGEDHEDRSDDYLCTVGDLRRARAALTLPEPSHEP